MNSSPKNVAEVFETYPEKIKSRLLEIRQLIFETAASTAGVGRLTETLKWGEPSYLTEQSRSGTTIRLGWKPSSPPKFAIYFHCRTSLVETFRSLFSEVLEFEGNRAIVFECEQDLPKDALRICLRHALTYHRRSKQDHDLLLPSRSKMM